MDEENANEALYLYNAVIEYIYFLVALIEAEGTKSVVNVGKHLQFFNHDIYGIVNMFNGEDLAEKIGTMLSTTTPIFNVKEGVLNLSLKGECFKRAIYKDLLISKIVDSVLRGICCIKDICHNLNLNNIIRIEEKDLTVILKKYPYFHLDSYNSVIIRQFHGLLGFEDHAYKTVVQYFQSYLQNINELTYNEVIFHEKFIPSCAISNPLFLFCVLHVCSIFKCEKSKVKLRKKFRKKYGNQIIDIEELNGNLSKSVPIGLLVSRALGRTLYSWTGEISELTKSNGLIQCVVTFSNEFQGIFIIYIYKTALKHICETEDLNDYLSIRDIVEFDAVYCDEAVDQYIFWQATRIKVIKQSLKKNKFNLNVDIKAYMDKVKLRDNSFNTTSRTCNLRNCNADFFVLEKNLSTKSQIKDNSSLFSDLDTKLSSKMKNTITKKSNNLSQDIFKNSLNETVTTVSHSLPLKDSKEGNLCDFKNVDDINLFTPRKDHNENNVLILHPWYFHSSFVFGKVSVVSENDGIAITMNTFKQNEVFFKSEVVFTENAKITPIKGSIVLLYIPYVELEDSVCVATLVYPLNPEETVLFKENITIENFVMNNFSPIVQKHLGAICSCFCGFTHTLKQKLLISQKFEIKREKIAKTFDFVKSLREAFCFSEKTLTRFYMLVNELFALNLGFSYTKICSGLAFIFVQAFSFTVCSKKLTILSKGKKIFNYHNHKRNHSSSHFLSHIKATCSKISEAAVISLKEKMNLFSHENLDIKEEILVESNDSCLLEKESNIKLDTALLLAKPFVKEGNESCISINSYKSCNSKSSEEVYYSCESLPDKFDAYSEKSLLIHSNSTHLFKDDDCNNTIIYNEINSPSFAGKNSDLLNEGKNIHGITVSNLSKKYTEKLELAEKSDFKVRHSSIFKAKNKRINHKIILSSSSHHCQECWKLKTETTAHISTITKSYLYFCVNFNQQVATLGFPKYLVSEKILKKLSSSSTIKIGIIPNILIHFSDVLYINLC